LVSAIVALIWLTAAPASAQADATSSTTTTQPTGDDDAQLDVGEPDFSLVNLPTTLRLPRNGGDFHLTHRFNQNLRDDFGNVAENLFGIDSGASNGLGF
jgi:hypothetical protein